MCVSLFREGRSSRYLHPPEGDGGGWARRRQQRRPRGFHAKLEHLSSEVLLVEVEAGGGPVGELVGQALELLGQRRRAAVEDACERRAPPGDQGAFLSLEMGGAGFRRLTDGGAGVPGGYSGEDVAPVGAGEVGPHLRGGGSRLQAGQKKPAC